MERDEVATADIIGRHNFNSHAHVERDYFFLLFDAMLCHFNSHAHVERDSVIVIRSPCKSISTHTLTWSVTDISSTFVTFFAISTHTLTWSVTLLL